MEEIVQKKHRSWLSALSALMLLSLAIVLIMNGINARLTRQLETKVDIFLSDQGWDSLVNYDEVKADAASGRLELEDITITIPDTGMTLELESGELRIPPIEGLAAMDNYRLGLYSSLEISLSEGILRDMNGAKLLEFGSLDARFLGPLDFSLLDLSLSGLLYRLEELSFYVDRLAFEGGYEGEGILDLPEDMPLLESLLPEDGRGWRNVSGISLVMRPVSEAEDAAPHLQLVKLEAGFSGTRILGSGELHGAHADEDWEAAASLDIWTLNPGFRNALEQQLEAAGLEIPPALPLFLDIRLGEKGPAEFYLRQQALFPGL